jgi:type III pantothenate kinase
MEMLLVIDVGNTNTVIGIYDGKRLVKDWRIRTERNTTEDEFNVLATALISGSGIDMAGVTKTVVACVVPPMRSILEAFCRKYLGHRPVWVDPRRFDLMPIRYNNPAEVGADRVVNAIGAYHRYRRGMVIIDFGTATTFDAISESGEYLGGAISPGIMISAEALFMKASKLPRVEIFSPPDHAIGKDTAESMQAGIIFGYSGLVDGLARKMADEMSPAPKIIATGGLAPLMAEVCETIEEVDLSLTLEGLRIIGELS